MRNGVSLLDYGVLHSDEGFNCRRESLAPKTRDHRRESLAHRQGIAQAASSRLKTKSGAERSALRQGIVANNRLDEAEFAAIALQHVINPHCV